MRKNHAILGDLAANTPVTLDKLSRRCQLGIGSCRALGNGALMFSPPLSAVPRRTESMEEVHMNLTTRSIIESRDVLRFYTASG